MTPERWKKINWKKIKRVFIRAAQLEPSQRKAYVARSCRGQDTLRDEVESLLSQHEKPDPFMGSISGKTILHYEVLDQIGKGGMGIVYKAHDKRLDRLVVLKFPTAWLMANPESKHRFVEEAKCAAALVHPNIVTIHGIEAVNGLDFIVMEYVPGKTLDRLIPPKGMAPAEALGYARQIVAALAKAHAARIIHGDLKPFNVMITEDGLAKVLDFGLARIVEPTETDDSGSSQQDPQRRDHVLLGTPDYMSPEQAARLAVDHRSDIFSFGAVLYEMLTGTRPFTGRSPSETIHAVQNRPARPMPARHSEALRKLVLRCLEKEPRRRFQSAQSLLSELERLYAACSPNQTPVAHREPYLKKRAAARNWKLLADTIRSAWRSRRGRALSLGAGLVLLIVAGYFAWFRPHDPVTTSMAGAAAATPDSDAYNRAVGLMREQKWDPAKALFDEVLRSDRANMRALYNRGVCLQNLYRWRDAIDDYSEVLRRVPNSHPESLYNRAMCHMNLEMLREALADLNAVIEIKPSREAYSNRGEVRRALGDAAGASDDQRSAAELRK